MNATSAAAPSQVREFHLCIGGLEHRTQQYDWIAHADWYLRDPAGTTRLVREVNAGGALPPEHAHKFFARVAIADEADVQRALEAADAAGRRFSRTPHAERKRLILAMGEALASHRADLAALGQGEGRPRMAFDLEFDHHYGERGTFRDATLDHHIRQLAGERLEGQDHVTYYPYGVVGFVPPGNAAIYNSLAGMMGALIAGNALVVKPPRNRAAQCLRFVEILQEVATRFGHPGLLNTVLGDSRSIIEQWADSPKVDVVVFYGGSGLGLEVGAMLTKKRTKALLELAGCDAALVWADADLDAAARAVFATRFETFSGQVCVAPKRLLVHRSVAQAFTDRLLALCAGTRWSVGLPSELFTDGPYLTPVLDMDRKLCLATLEDARRKGKPVLCGGRWLDHAGQPDPDGPFLEPTIIGDATPDLHCMKNEVFAPVLPIMVVDDLEQAIEVANATIYGLRATLWTRSEPVAERFIEASRTGSVFVNDHGLYFDAKAPYIGGIKASGFIGSKYWHLELSIKKYVHHGRPEAPGVPILPGADGAAAEVARGRELHQAGRLAEAAAAFREAVRRDPGHAEAYACLAHMFGQAGQPREAVQVLDAYLARHPAAPGAAALQALRARWSTT